MISQRIAAPYEPLAQSAARTPDGKRFLKPRQKKLDKSNNERSPLAMSTTSSRDNAVKNRNRYTVSRQVEQTTHRKSDEIKVRVNSQKEGELELTVIKTYFATSRQVDDRSGVEGVHHSSVLPHTPVTVWSENKRLPRGAPRRDIYELTGDENGFVAAPAPELPVTESHTRPSVNAPYAEPKTSSFRYPDSPSSSESQESRTIEECLKIARQPPQTVHEKASKPLSNPAKSSFGGRVDGNVAGEALEPLSPQQ
jgi:hypothetical protein